MFQAAKAYLIGGLVLALVLVGLWLAWQWDTTTDDLARAQQQVRGLQSAVEANDRALKVSEQNRRDERELARLLREDLNALTVRAVELDRAAARGAAVDERLRRAEASALACGRRRATTDAAAAAAVRAADEAIELHARLLDRLGAEEAEAARFAEDSFAASAGCAASYRREQALSDAAP